MFVRKMNRANPARMRYRLGSNLMRRLSYFFSQVSNHFLAAGALDFWRLGTRVMWEGRSRRDSRRLEMSMRKMTGGIYFTKLAYLPVNSSSGMKAAQVVRMLAMMGAATSWVPSRAACLRGSPSLIFREIFSATMIASSTTIPSTMMMADRVTPLMV